MRPYRTNVRDVPVQRDLREDEGWVNMQVQFLIDEPSAGSPELVVGRTVLPPGARHERHRHPNCDEFLVVLSGSGEIYTNTGIELAAAHLATAAGIPFDTYLREAVLDPLAMGATTLGTASPAAGAVAPVGDLLRFAAELLAPTLVAPATLADAVSVQYPGLKGRVPGIGPMDPCDWGLGFELRDGKVPHWTGSRNSPATFGHFGGSGTFLWVDPVAGVACVALTDRPFDEWALQHWPEFSDRILAEVVPI